ncbi:hypothetical protein FOA43_000425 [Brettanomyces nanus]|uniref:Uncharacterized protein n=1 Tax=Eeniella nana TaxID=13502 RepID=A0A875RN31_EENNA|nr:uncharacterized protein FOA43_000425 [Brettanomyces nanus]QPG73120.1 hypothetical protein FOA43_000425 [Brettanomyces nanus]
MPYSSPSDSAEISSTQSAPAGLTPFPGSTGQTSVETDEEFTYHDYPQQHRKSSHVRKTLHPNVGYYGSLGERNSFLASRSTSITESIANSVISVTQMTLRQMRRQRFLTVCIFGVIFMLLFKLIFMPRTSLDRDLRRLHGEYLTLDDCSRLFLTHLTLKNDIRRYMKCYSEEIHTTGDNYEATVELFREFPTFKTSTEKYEAWFSRPQESWLRVLSADNKVIYDANLQETELMSFYPYSASGKMRAKYVYANYGSVGDFQQLNASGIPVEDRIVILRNGNLHPSIKIQNAQRVHVAGAVIYSDPYDDGKYVESHGYAAFPDGFARNHHAIQKDTLSRILEQPGDPTTPGWSSTLFSKRVKPETIPTIPVLPISFAAIQPILDSLSNGADLGWKGDYANFSYSASVSENTLELGSTVQFKIKPIYNIITEIKGIIRDEVIYVGASRDIVGGIGGASSGFSELLELARGFNELAKKGWKPLRTIKLISWDGSAAGLLGSTEFGEFYEGKLRKNAVVYVNLDGVKGSRLLVESNPLYGQLLVKSMKEILVDDDTTLWEYYIDRHQHNGSEIDLISQRSGDYSVFQCFVGVPSINIGFSNVKDKDPVPYTNSKYDSEDWQLLLDRKLRYHNLVAQFAGLFVLQISEREIIDVGTGDYMSRIQQRFDVLSSRVPSGWKHKKMKIRGQKDGRNVGEEIERLDELLSEIVAIAKNFDDHLVWLQRQILQDYPWFKMYVKIKIAFQIKIASAKIKALDKLFVAPEKYTNVDVDGQREGLLKGRKWFRHLIFAPDRVSGYRLEVLPGFTEALQNGEYGFFERNIQAFGEALEKVYSKLR